MSRNSEARYKLKSRYFEELKETSLAVDPFVDNFIKNYLDISNEIKLGVLERYRFKKPKLRPAQVRFAYELAGGLDWKKVIPLCGAIELKDTSYYCADDVFDKNENSKTMYIVGNLLSVIANSMINEMEQLVNSKEKFSKIYKSVFTLDSQIYQGFYIDENMKGTGEEYYMKKAYAYNYWEHILKMAALTTNADDIVVNNISEIGKNIGIAYTIANDTCDFGKPNLEDFATGKYTLPIIFAMNNISETAKEKLNRLIGKGELVDADKEVVRKIIVQSGAIKYGKSKAWEFCEKALLILKDFPNSKAKEMLEFSTTMTQRNKYYDVLNRYI
ncbi:MAG: polyprenyl synthetase family protein [Candidatus Pacebacteria bacterium]|nr:polyprenyl synthetase family protein [Candidatus Paceibacterota bacterium]